MPKATKFDPNLLRSYLEKGANAQQLMDAFNVKKQILDSYIYKLMKLDKKFYEVEGMDERVMTSAKVIHKKNGITIPPVFLRNYKFQIGDEFKMTVLEDGATIQLTKTGTNTDSTSRN